MDTNGTITTVAGNGEFGSSGDGGPAIGANMANPQGLSFDDSGNLYIADSKNKLVRKLETRSDDGVPGTSGTEMPFNLFIPAAMQ